tara:strand:+ start:923 stop:1321 length:399 start_codon:yes stop_codon:yes gene_type:complete
LVDLNPEMQILGALIDATYNKRLLFCVPESAGDIFLSTSLLPSMKENYPDFDIYFGCNRQFHGILKGNPNIYKVLPYMSIMENVLVMEGYGDWRGFFDVSITATVLTQRFINYHHNGMDVSSFNFRKQDAPA